MTLRYELENFMDDVFSSTPVRIVTQSAQQLSDYTGFSDLSDSSKAIVASVGFGLTVLFGQNAFIGQSLHRLPIPSFKHSFMAVAFFAGVTTLIVATAPVVDDAISDMQTQGVKKYIGSILRSP